MWQRKAELMSGKAQAPQSKFLLIWFLFCFCVFGLLLNPGNSGSYNRVTLIGGQDLRTSFPVTLCYGLSHGIHMPGRRGLPRK